MNNLKNTPVHIPDIDNVDELCRRIDWRQYKSELEASLANERIWELGCLDEYNPHTHNIVLIEKELALLNSGEYEAILRMHDVEYFNDYLED